MYGDWSVDDIDIAEVLGYRAGIILSALCAGAVFAAAGATDEQLLPAAVLNGFCLAGTAGFATSLVLIHIYVTEIKRTIQVCVPLRCQPLWSLMLPHRARTHADGQCIYLFADCCKRSVYDLQALFLFGALGEVWLMASHDQAVVNFVAEHPWATLLVGPAFAAVTGVAIKEGLCYGKLNAASLALVRFHLCSHAFVREPSYAFVLQRKALALFCKRLSSNKNETGRF